MHVGKKTLSALMALTLTASLAACSASTPAETAEVEFTEAEEPAAEEAPAA